MANRIVDRIAGRIELLDRADGAVKVNPDGRSEWTAPRRPRAVVVAPAATPIVSEAFSALADELERAESELHELTQVLQTERACMANFEIPDLLAAVQRKEEILQSITDHSPIRRHLFKNMWAEMGLSLDCLPDHIPEALRVLSESSTGVQERPALEAASDVPIVDVPIVDVSRAALEPFREIADRLEVLYDVIHELQTVNRSLVKRALGWIDGYLAELTGVNLPSIYDATGRLRENATSALRRTV